MPGRGSYGPGGKWIHDRAHRIMSEGKTEAKYGPEKGKQVAYALATQQAHKLGKTPKKKGGYGTTSGRAEAKAKYDQPRKAYKKTASMAGQDLRKPFMGGTKFPTLDSKSIPMQNLRSSQKAAEVGPVPSPKQLRPKGPSIKYGADMSDDPLIQYLRKQAFIRASMPSVAKTIVQKGKRLLGKGRMAPEKTLDAMPVGAVRKTPSNVAFGSLNFAPKATAAPLRKAAAALDDNLEDMPTGSDEGNLTSECPMPGKEVRSQPAKDKSMLGELFDHPSKEAKYLARMHPATSGSVDRVLKRH